MRLYMLKTTEIIHIAAWLTETKGEDGRARDLLKKAGIKTLVELNQIKTDPNDITICEMLW